MIAGESYGGFRVAALARALPEDFAIAPNGAILISPLMEYAMLGGNDFNLLPWAADPAEPRRDRRLARPRRLAAAAGKAGRLAAALAPAEGFALVRDADRPRRPSAPRPRGSASMPTSRP